MIDSYIVIKTVRVMELHSSHRIRPKSYFNILEELAHCRNVGCSRHNEAQGVSDYQITFRGLRGLRVLGPETCRAYLHYAMLCMPLGCTLRTAVI